MEREANNGSSMEAIVVDASCGPQLVSDMDSS
jgi:hypothetical protein